MRLYHGSPMKVEQPELELCRPHNDYGRGLYCTQDKELAMEWACNRPGQNGFCNAYELDLEGLAVLNLDDASYGVLAWLAVLMEHRIFDSEWNAASTKDRFIERYRVDLSDADVVCGYRADDSYFSIARAFLSGAITDTQAAEALHLGNLGRQTMLRSPPEHLHPYASQGQKSPMHRSGIHAGLSETHRRDANSKQCGQPRTQRKARESTNC